MKKIFLLLALAAAVIMACVNLPVPPPGFTMYCDVCERVTDWGVAAEYFYCRESGTVWIPMED